MAIVVLTIACALPVPVLAEKLNNDLPDLTSNESIPKQQQNKAGETKSENQVLALIRLSENDTRRPIIGIAAEGKPDPVITLYGIVDIGYAHLTNTKPSVTGSDFPLIGKSDDLPWLFSNGGAGLINGGMQDSRWGIRSYVNLGNQRKAFITLESGMKFSTSSLNDAYKDETNGGNSSSNGKLFGRQAFIGLSDPKMGSMSFGRQYNLIYDVLTAYDPVFKSDLFSPLGMSGTMGGGGGNSENLRLDNSVKYQVKSGNFNFGALYKFGGSSFEDPTTGYVFNAGYSEGNFGVQVVYEAFDDTLKAAATSTPSMTIYDSTASMVTGKYQINALTLKAGFEHYVAKSTSSAASGSASQIISYASTNINSVLNATAVGIEQPTNIAFAGGDYNVTQKFNLAFGFYNIHQHAYAAGKEKDGSSTSSGSAGTITWETLIADYKINKYFDMYAGVSYIQLKGARYTLVSTKDLHNIVSAVGLRLKF